MNSKIYPLFIFIVLSTLLFSCGSNDTTLRKNITGNAGELVVVISKDAWDKEPGNVIREILAQPQVMLPQEEPLFDLIDVPHNAFKQIFKTTRNILQTSISPNVDKEGVKFTDDVWAYPQATVQISAKTPEKFVELFNENKDKILSYFLAAEKERNTMNYNRVHEKAVLNTLSQDFGITMKVPPGFRIVKQAKDFIWIQYDTPEIFQGIIIYIHPFVSDSAFTINYQLPIRDSILKAQVEGPTDGSYMSTEKRLDQVFNVQRHNGNYAAEMRGLWRLENDFMGGPYVALSELDVANQRVINAFGFVYAPSKEKRNLLRQVEAMIYSLKLNNQKDNDKLNKQEELEINVEG
ncbi:DUF4837 family protein [Maribellus mangrovi]|uniref:DUF4837 family protein n=1 Tax=Maribellus mangrovi TaxID=3133146 RepID=UPI0030EF078E